MRNFLKQNKLGKFSDEAQDAEERAKQKELDEEEMSKSMKIGDRCEVTVPKQPTKIGTVMFKGNLPSAFTLWVFFYPLWNLQSCLKVRHFWYIQCRKF